MDSVSINSYAKINLGLDVTGIREDGYHNVKMVMQTISLCDSLVFKKIKVPKIILKTNLPYLPVNSNNIVYAAIQSYMDEYGIDCGVMATINKRIPVAAGMAGGSGNAAATLIAMDRLFGYKTDMTRMMEIGLKLGADVPYCIMGGTALAEGIGEKLTRLPAPPKAKILIVKPGINVSTKSVYTALDSKENLTHPDIDGIVSAMKKNDLNGMCGLLGNVLEEVTAELYPEIKSIKESMLAQGAAGALMSGSGPTVFGLFEDKETAEKAYYSFKNGKYSSSSFLCDYVN